MIDGKGHPHVIGTIQSACPLTTLESGKEMEEGFQMTGGTMSEVLQIEDPHMMITTETNLPTPRTLLYMALLVTHPTLKRLVSLVSHQELRKSQRLFLLRVFWTLQDVNLGLTGL